jgi:CRISPR/Cas system CMR-associated protein Cmr3 (group 5 of RAMP superfamily)
MNARKARRIAIRILDEFEDLLDEKNVTIPSSDREGREEEARLYGSEYYRLEDAITKILVEETKGWWKGGDRVGLLDK